MSGGIFKMDLVSVIIPVFNGEKTIKKAIDSVLHQTYENIEIIVVDDCSTDGTFLLLQSLAKKHSQITVYKNEKNMGTAKSRNIGISHAKGKYVAFIDTDDLWRKDKIDKQIRLLLKNGDLCYTASVIMNKNTVVGKRTVPLKTDYKRLLKENTIACSSVLIKKNKLLPFDSSYFHEDYALWLKLLKNGCKAVGINESLLYYHLGGRSADKKNAAKHRWEIYRKSEKFGLLKSAYYFLFYAFNGLLNAHKIKKYTKVYVRTFKYREDARP